MGAPKKPIKKSEVSKSDAEDDDESVDQKPKKKIVDDDEDDFDVPLDDLGYENFDNYDDDEDF